MDELRGSSTVGRELLFVDPVRRIIGRFYFRKPLDTDRVDFGDPVLERNALDVILHLAIAESAFQGDELPLFESPGKLGEVSPGIDAVPFGAVLVIALVVLPAFLGGDIENDVLVLVLGGFGFCVLSEAADEGDFVEHVVWLRFFLVCPLSAVHACPEGVPSRPTPSASGENLRKGTQTRYGDRSPHLEEARSGALKGERASEGRGCLERGTLNADRRQTRREPPCSTTSTQGASSKSQLTT